MPTMCSASSVCSLKRRSGALAWLLGAVLLLGAAAARADTPISLFKSFAGNVNFTGTQKTLRSKANTSDPCSLVSGGAVTAVLSGIPTGATVLNAQLYWAASGSTPDLAVVMDGVAVAAPGSRQYTTATVGYDFFSGAADVTAQVVAKRNGNYVMSGLSVDNNDPYCGVEAVLGGFQLLVIYSNVGETFRVLNLYEGLQFVRNSSLTLNLSNFLTPNPIGSATGRIGHISWEGDTTLSGGGEDLRFNGIGMVDTMNPSGNQFNSASNINNDASSYGIDFDAYTVKSPTIQSNQTSASTYYSSGADLVLLNAEIIAAPNVPATDRSITMALDGPLAQSKTSIYTITVGNNGPMTEAGPIIVTDTLPSVFIVGAAGGIGWSCSTAGQTVTCSNPGPLAVGDTLKPLTIAVTAAANASGTVTTSATVAGALFDYYDGNNTANVSSIIGAALFTPSYVFTDAVCAHNQAFGTPGQPCKILVPGTRIADVPIAGLYITYVSNGVPTSLSSSATTVQMKFALSCHDPIAAAGKQATFTSVSATGNKLPLCVGSGALPAPSNSAWSAFNGLVFPGGVPTVNVNNTLQYADVGRIELYMSDNSNRLGSTGAFVSRPLSLVLTANTLAGGANPATSPADAGNGAFVAAGAPFKLSWTAMTGGLVPIAASNFGRESTPAQVVVASPARASDTDGVFVDMDPIVPLLTGNFGAISNGAASGSNFVFPDVGIIELNVALVGGNYLGGGAITGATLNVGRFYPDHFVTLPTGLLACPAALACPATAATLAYSRQAFTLRTTAVNAAGATTRNYAGVFARPVTVSVWNAAGSSTTQNPPLVPLGSTLAPAALLASNFIAGVSDPGTSIPPPPATFTVTPNFTYSFPLAYSSAAPRATNLAPPTFVYVRAAETAGSGDGVTSLHGTASTEGGLAIVSGRLQLANNYGSELLMMPVNMQAQYFAGATTGWRDNEQDTGANGSAVSSTGIAYSRCTKKLGPPCSAALVGVTGLTTVTALKGAAKLYLHAPGSGNNGSVDVQLNNPVWLPSTIGRLVFGQYRGQFIYLRELY